MQGRTFTLVLGIAHALSAHTWVRAVREVGAQEFAYAPGTATYRMVVKSAGTSDAQGTKHDIGLDAEQRLTLTIAARTRDTIALAIVLDSATIKTVALGTLDARPALGLRVTAMLTPQGKVYSRQLPDMKGREAFTAVAEEMARFLPALPATLSVGATWRDTTREPVEQMGIPITRTRITDYRVAADTILDGERTWRIARTAHTLMQGSGTTMGAPVVFESNSIGTGAYYLSRSGRYLGAELKEEVKSKVTLTALNQDVLGTQTQTAVITLVR